MRKFSLARLIYGCVSDVMRSCHVVQRGESLWQISLQYGVTLEALIAANLQIKDPDMIFPGQVIIIPC